MPVPLRRLARLLAGAPAYGLVVAACCAALAAAWVLGAPLRGGPSAGCLFGDGESYCAMARGEPGHEPFSRRPLAPLAVRALGLGVVDGFRVVAWVSTAVAAAAGAAVAHRVAAAAAPRDRKAAAALAAALLVAMPYGWRFASAFPVFTDLPALALGLAWLAVLGRSTAAGALLAGAVVLAREHWSVAVVVVGLWLLARGRWREGAAYLVAAATALAVALGQPSQGFDHTNLSAGLLHDPRKLVWSLAVGTAIPLAALLALRRSDDGRGQERDGAVPLLLAAAALLPLALVGGSDVPRLLAPVTALLLVAVCGRLAVARRGRLVAPLAVVLLLLLWRFWAVPSAQGFVVWFLPYEVPAERPRVVADVVLAAAGAAAVAAASRLRLRSSW